MPLFGSHQSIAGGIENAVYTAAKLGFDTVQFFSKSSNQWKGTPIDEVAVKRFCQSLQATGIKEPLIHDSYLINLASPKQELYDRSRNAFAEELIRASWLGVSWVVMHPGAATEDSRENGLNRISSALRSILKETPPEVGVLLETTAGQGTTLGSTFEELAKILGDCHDDPRLAVCLDTCHVFAAGYDFTTPEKYAVMMDRFDRTIGLNRLKAFHLNDSVRECGARVDRHSSIGFGKIGEEPFGFFLNDPRFAQLPMYLETPAGEMVADGETIDLDIVNLRTLKRLIKH